VNVFDELATVGVPAPTDALHVGSKAEAEKVSRMDCREMQPDEKYVFLTCQIGKQGFGRFHLKAFGATWNAALMMLWMAGAIKKPISAGNNKRRPTVAHTGEAKEPGRNPSSPAENLSQEEIEHLPYQIARK